VRVGRGGRGESGERREGGVQNSPCVISSQRSPLPRVHLLHRGRHHGTQQALGSSSSSPSSPSCTLPALSSDALALAREVLRLVRPFLFLCVPLPTFNPPSPSSPLPNSTS
jgi:hypothetical protein